MVAAIEKIDRDITALKEAISAIAQEIRSIYSSYLAALGQAVRQQMIMASYHLCTQVYPETFLKLSLNQRQHLQQALQQLGQQAEQQLCSFLQLFFAFETPELSVTEIKNLGQVPASLEQAVTEELRTISRTANHLLQNCDILPGTALEALLEVAAKAEDSGSAVPGPPNLLTALVEAKDSSVSDASTSDNTAISEQSQVVPKVLPENNGESLSSEDVSQLLNNAFSRSTSTAVMIIYLRLDEIEFVDSTVMAWRNQIRKLSTRLASLLQELEKKQRERIVAEAQVAWRSSWPGS
jgi:hypothetical protein